MMKRILQLISLITLILIENIECHTYKVNYHNEEQVIHVVKDGQASDIHFGDIVEIGNNRKIVYVGNGKWRENDNPLNKHWPEKVHDYGAADIESWPEFVKTGFEVLDNQLEKNQGDLEKASASAKHIKYADRYINIDNANQNTNYFQNKIIIGIASIIFIGCCHFCVVALICAGCKALCKKPKKYDFNDRLPSNQYRRLPIRDHHAIDMQNVEYIFVKYYMVYILHGLLTYLSWHLSLFFALLTTG